MNRIKRFLGKFSLWKCFTAIGIVYATTELTFGVYNGHDILFGFPFEFLRYHVYEMPVPVEQIGLLGEYMRFDPLGLVLNWAIFYLILRLFEIGYEQLSRLYLKRKGGSDGLR